MKMLKPLLITAAVIGIQGAAYAGNNSDLSRLHVQLSNQTAVVCYLHNQKLIHGLYESAPPPSIYPGNSQGVDIVQFSGWMGIEAEWTYWCSEPNYMITFRVGLPAHMLIGKTPTVKVIDSNWLKLDSSAQSSSVFYGSAGILYVGIQDIENSARSRESNSNKQ
ncbi:MAG TPA: hypothetical protein VNC84_03575 [Gammaproteobacteria bacterium]|jgi:hypothetical protein|nr:hypothetical protein [Gammaproteobacteria bacterium]